MQFRDRLGIPRRRLAALAATSALVTFGSAVVAVAAMVVAPPAAYAQVGCPAGTALVPVTWGGGNAVQWSRNSTSTTASDLGGSDVDLTITMTDPAQRNGDDSNPLAAIGDANSDPGEPLFGWDSRVYTETDGAYGAGYLTLGMNSLDVGDTVTLALTFSRPVLLPDFSVGDIDYVGLGFSPPEEPWNSFQDRVRFTATRSGAPVGVTLTALGGTSPQISGDTAVGGPYLLGTDGGLDPGDAAGTLRGATDEPVTSFTMAYSNGPDDAAAEAGPSYPPPPILTPPADSVSDSHAVRLDVFSLCVGTASVGDRVWADVDGDGVQDAGEPGMSGVTVELSGPDGNVVATTTTDAAGAYLFDQLPAFDWTVEVDPATLPPGVTQTGDPDATLDNRTTVTVDPGDDVMTADFGYLPPMGVVSGTVFADRNDNGVLNPGDGDGGIAGVDLALTGTDLAGNPVSRTTSTGPDGSYSFSDVPAGTYAATETQPADYDDGQDTPGTNAAANGDDSFTVTLPVGGSSVGNDLAELPTGSLAGQVYVDADNDGVHDSGETPIPGTTVALTGTDDAGVVVALSTTTNGAGAYSFDRLRPGTYAVTESQSAGYLDGRDAAGTAGGTVGQDTVTAIGLDPAEDAIGYDFGELAAGSITGSVVEDDGTPIEGVSVELAGIDDLGDAVSLTTVTSSDGSWSFANLRPGEYAVTETQPTGFGDGVDVPGSAGGVLSGTDTIAEIMLDPGESATGYLFVEVRSSLAGFVYVDANNNGVRDSGEVGIPNVAVTLTAVPCGPVGGSGVDVEAVGTVFTDADGSYLFDRLLAGGYVVTEAQPSAYLDGGDAAGTAGGVVGQDTVTRICLPAGVDATGYTFGELAGASIAGSVVEDDGTPIGGVTVELTGTDDLGDAVSLTTVTNSGGLWSFSGLRPGEYAVTETQPVGFGDGVDVPGSAGGVSSGGDTIDSIVLDAAEQATGYVFIEVRSSLAGTVYVDVDDDGVQGMDEPGIAGVTVMLTGTDDAGDPVSRTTTTDSDGDYLFDDLLGGDYTVTETQPAAYADGQDTPGSAGGTPQGTDSIELRVPVGTDAVGYDFGELGASITGIVWLDTDGDGVTDAAEPTRLPGVELELLDDEGEPMATTMTGQGGAYVFAGLLPGDYTVRETQPDGYGTTTANELEVTVPVGGGATADFGEQLGTIGDFVWFDADADGVQDADEDGVAGVTVILLQGHATVGMLESHVTEVARTTTDADGRFAFVDLPVGTYQVEFELPAGLAFTLPGRGTTETGSDADRVTGATRQVDIEVGDDGTISQVLVLDAGLVPARPDLAVELTVDKPTPAVGDTVTYTGTVTNSGNTPVNGTMYTQSVPSGLTIRSASGDGWTCMVTGQEVACARLGIAMPGEVLPPITVVTTVTRAGVTLTSVATTASLDGQVETTLANNVDAVQIAVAPAPPAPQPAPPPNLPATGASVALLGLTGALLVGMGLTLLTAGSRRRRTHR